MTIIRHIWNILSQTLLSKPNRNSIILFSKKGTIIKHRATLIWFRRLVSRYIMCFSWVWCSSVMLYLKVHFHKFVFTKYVPTHDKNKIKIYLFRYCPSFSLFKCDVRILFFRCEETNLSMFWRKKVNLPTIPRSFRLIYIFGEIFLSSKYQIGPLI